MEGLQKIVLDLSGKGGLGNKFFGDIDQITPTPNNRYSLAENELAQGIFNPFIRDGYLSPSIATLHTVTTDQTLSQVIGSTVYDDINDDVYLAERGRQIFKGDGLGDLSFSRVKELAPTDSDIQDLEIYQINGERKLFYVYTSKGEVGNKVFNTDLSSSVDWISIGGRVNPHSTVEPTLIASGRATGASSASTLNLFMDIPSGTNTALVVIAACYTATSVNSGTYDGNSMSSSTNGSYSGGITINYRVLTYLNPTPGTGKQITITYGASTVNRLVTAYVFENVDQTTPITLSSLGSQITDLATQTITISAANQFAFANVISARTAHYPRSPQEQVFNSDNTVGTDSFTYIRTSAIRLRTGIADLEFASSNDDWLTSTVQNNFMDEAFSTYNFIRLADNGFAYLFSDNKVHKIDGTTVGGENGTISKDVLLFPSFFRITDAQDYRGNMFMVIHQSKVDTTSRAQKNYSIPCGIYIWDRLTTQVRMRDFIPIDGIRMIKKIYVAPTTGRLRLITISSEGITQIREFGGSTFEVIKELGIGAAPQYSDSLTTSGLKTVWLAPDGNFYCHGKGTYTDREALAIIGRVRAPSAETTAGYSTNIVAGAVLFGNDDTSVATGFRGDRQGYLISYDDGTKSIRKIYPFDISPVNSTNQTPLQGDIYTGVTFFPTLSDIHKVDIICQPNGSTGGTTTVAILKFYANQKTTPFKTYTVTNGDINKGYITIEFNKPYVHSVQMEIEYANITLGSNNFNPAYAIFYYKPTATSRQKV